VQFDHKRARDWLRKQRAAGAAERIGSGGDTVEAVVGTPIPNDSSDRHDILHMSAQAKMQSADLLFQIWMFRKQDT
jgi:hypothetical protein